jgi:hypothetical protein
MNAVLKKIVQAEEHYKEFAELGLHSEYFGGTLNLQGFNHIWSMRGGEWTFNCMALYPC